MLKPNRNIHNIEPQKSDKEKNKNQSGRKLSSDYNRVSQIGESQKKTS